MTWPKRKTPQGNRGRTWEQYLDGLHQEYEQQGRAACTRNHFQIHQRSPANSDGVFTATYGAPAAVDYRIDSAGWSFVFDAKQVNKSRFPWANLHPHQARYLDQVEIQGTLIIGFLALHNAPYQQGIIVLWSELRDDYWRWRRHKDEQDLAAKKGKNRQACPRGQGSITWEQLAARAIYAGSTAPFTGQRFDYLQTLQLTLDNVRPCRLEYRHRLAAEAAHHHHHLRPWMGPRDLEHHNDSPTQTGKN